MLPKTRSELELSTLIMTDTFEKDENFRYVK